MCPQIQKYMYKYIVINPIPINSTIIKEKQYYKVTAQKH